MCFRVIGRILRLHFENGLLLHLYVTKHTCPRYGRKDQCALDVVCSPGNAQRTKHGVPANGTSAQLYLN